MPELSIFSGRRAPPYVVLGHMYSSRSRLPSTLLIQNMTHTPELDKFELKDKYDAARSRLLMFDHDVCILFRPLFTS